MQVTLSLPQQELLTGWSSMKGGRKRGEQNDREERRDREEKKRKRKKEILTGSPPSPLASNPIHSNQEGEDTEGRRREELQAQLHVNPIITSHDHLNWHDGCCAVQ
ncbi:hypothetical protein ILYODFUR_002150 [Ilyodon furcidens]|uniref:Uncharacterized protein n=1 Tax=Ilyodon furcidens TaxID=33524 RepID=A0ABV0TJC2_9TELE